MTSRPDMTPDLRPDAPEDDTLTGQSYAAGRAELAAEQAAPALVRPTVTAGMKIIFTIFLGVPFLALLLAIPVAWGGWLSWVDIGLAVFFYVITAMGITVGYHRHFTHGSFKAPPGARRLGRARVDGSGGVGGPVGGRPPQAPRVQRRRGRPALAVAVRHLPAGGGQGPVVRPRRVAVRHRADPGQALRPRRARRTPTCGWRRCLPRPGRRDVPAARRVGGPDHLVLARAR